MVDFSTITGFSGIGGEVIRDLILMFDGLISNIEGIYKGLIDHVQGS